MDADGHALFELLDSKIVKPGPYLFVEYFTAGDYPHMKLVCDRGAKLVPDFLAQILPLRPESRSNL